MRAVPAAGLATDSAGARRRLWSLVVVLIALVGVSCTALPGASAERVWVVLVLAPLAEEAVFRAGLQEVLLRHWHAPLVANLATAATFGLAHAVSHGDAAAFAAAGPALLIGVAYTRWRQLRLCVVLHAAMNAAWLAWRLAGAAPYPGP